MRLFQSTICVNEDREAWEPSLRVVLASLSLHCPGMAISLFYPVANQAFRRWLSAYPQVQAADGSPKEWLRLERKATGHHAIARCWLRRSHLDRFGRRLSPGTFVHCSMPSTKQSLWPQSTRVRRIATTTMERDFARNYGNSGRSYSPGSSQFRRTPGHQAALSLDGTMVGVATIR